MRVGKTSAVWKKSSVASAVIATLASMAPSGAYAIAFEVGDGWAGNWDTSVSLGTSIRARNPDKRLIGRANGALAGYAPESLSGNNTTGDQGELNYKKGDTFTTLLKVITEVELKKGSMGAFARAKAWYDYTLNEEGVRFGNQGNGYRAGAPLSDRGFESLNKFDGVALLDAYVYDTFDIKGLPLQVRLGNQTLNWGESVFVQGINQINPIDVPAFRKPGAQVKEVLIPVPILSASLGLGSAGSIDAFYQLKWKNTPIDAACGNYWSVAEGAISASPGSCYGTTPLVNSPFATANNMWAFTSGKGRKPGDSGQAGIAYHVNSETLDTEFGAFAMNIHARTPNIGVYFGPNVVVPASPANPNPGMGMGDNLFGNANWDYAKNIRVYGLTASTNLAGWSVASELSFQKGVPVQKDGNDLLYGVFGFGPLAAQLRAAQATGFYQGWDRYDKTQFQINTVKAAPAHAVGAGLWLLVAEAGFQWNNVPNYKSDPNAPRYGRNFMFGPGANPAYGGNTCGTFNVNQEGCANDGYVSRFAWGYRLYSELQYTNVGGTGIAVTPNIYWAHDVDGYSMDGQFLKDRKVLGVGVKFSYAKKYNLELNATTFNHNAKFDALRDRDFYSATASMSF